MPRRLAAVHDALNELAVMGSAAKPDRRIALLWGLSERGNGGGFWASGMRPWNAIGNWRELGSAASWIESRISEDDLASKLPE